MNFRSRSIAPPTSSLCAMSPSARDRSTMSCTSGSIRCAPGLARAARSPRPAGPPREMIPARSASSMSWLMYATRSTIRTTRPSSVAGFSGPVWLRIPSRTCSVRLSPRPSRSSTSTTRSECSLCRKPHPVLPQRLVEHLLADVPERRMPEVVAQPDRLGQVLVQPQRPRHRPRDAAGLERVREPRPVVVALRRHEHLRLVLEPPERLRVHDPVAVALERRPHRAVGSGSRRCAGIRRRRQVPEVLRLPGADPLLEGLGLRGHPPMFALRRAAPSRRAVDRFEIGSGPWPKRH